MAKGKIFIGEIMGDMVASLGSLETAMDSQVLKMDDQITELQVINTTVGQGISSGNLIPADTGAVLNTVDITAQSTLKASVGKVKCFGKGKVRVRGEIKTASGTGAKAILYYSLNGAADVQVQAAVAETYSVVSADIAVKDLDEIELKIFANTGATATIKANTGIVGYDLVNLAGDGYIVKV